MSQVEDRFLGASQRADPQPEPLDLGAYLRPVRRWKWVILAIAILAAGATYGLTSREQKTYTAEALVEVQNANPTVPASNPPTTQQLQDVATLFTDRAITTTVYNDLRLPVGTAGSVVVSPSSTSDFVDVTASSHSAALAARLANTYVSVFLASQAQTVAVADQAAAAAARATLKALRNTPANLAQRQALIATIVADDAAARNPSPGATAPDPALVPKFPSSPAPKKDALFAGLIGLLLGIGLAFVLDLADRRLVRVSSVQSIYGRSVVAVLPHVANAAPRDHGTFLTPPEFVEVMRSLRVNLRLAANGTTLKSVVVTSALPGEGKSTVARDLAFAYADAGDRVLVIDCDLRRPSLSSVFAVRPELGLVQVLRSEVSPAEAAVTVFRTSPSSSNGSAGQPLAAGDPRVHGSISLISHGERVESPAALLSSKAMSELLATASAYYDMVILDTSPILTVSDAVPLLDQVSAVLFVARLGMTTREAAERLTELGQRVPHMNLAGVVVNDMRDSYVDEGYGSYSQYGYTYGHPEAAPVKRAARVPEAVRSNGAWPAYGSPQPDDAPASVQPTSSPHDPTSAYDPASPYDPSV
jgi:Mrp family chromosome partitioning ATPase/capsular polysaccharide biosynthesis protein